jgi:hypothetical protein
MARTLSAVSNGEGLTLVVYIKMPSGIEPFTLETANLESYPFGYKSLFDVFVTNDSSIAHFVAIFERRDLRTLYIIFFRTTLRNE